MPQIKFTIITPTLLRPTLKLACESISIQKYKNWKHLIVVDDPSVNLNHFLLTNPNLQHPNRTWFKCEEAHHNVGNTCRSLMYNEMDYDTNYILYLDDDNFYLTDALDILASELESRSNPSWGTFPILRFDKPFIHKIPRKNYVDTNQIYHKPTINNHQIRYFAVDDYAADGLLANWLTKLTSPTVLSNLPELLSMPSSSYGSPIVPSPNSDPYAIVIPNKFEDIILPLFRSFSHYNTNPSKVIIVSDNHDRNYGFESVRVDGEFIYSKSANAGIRHAVPHDVILLNDDIRLIQPDTFNKLFKIAYSDPSIGILSPLIDGGCGNVYMDVHRIGKLWTGSQHIMYREGTGYDYISFACVYLKRQLLNQIGLLDENFTGFARDDADMCIRAVRAGWRVAITKDVRVRHGSGGSTYIKGQNYNTSYQREGTGQWETNSSYFFKKHPDQPRERRWPQPFTPSPMVIVPGTSWKDRLKNHSTING